MVHDRARRSGEDIPGMHPQLGVATLPTAARSGPAGALGDGGAPRTPNGREAYATLRTQTRPVR